MKRKKTNKRIRKEKNLALFRAIFSLPVSGFPTHFRPEDIRPVCRVISGGSERSVCV
jgi:hypothetical protein